jgi:hypothetical protein
VTKKEYLESKGFEWVTLDIYIKEDVNYCQYISIERKNPYITVKCYSEICSDNDIKKLQIVFNNLKQIQEECMKLPTYHRRKQ